jgi:hypothetical protein
MIDTLFCTLTIGGGYGNTATWLVFSVRQDF